MLRCGYYFRESEFFLEFNEKKRLSGATKYCMCFQVFHLRFLGVDAI